MQRYLIFYFNKTGSRTKCLASKANSKDCDGKEYICVDENGKLKGFIFSLQNHVITLEFNLCHTKNGACTRLALNPSKFGRPRIIVYYILPLLTFDLHEGHHQPKSAVLLSLVAMEHCLLIYNSVDL